MSSERGVCSSTNQKGEAMGGVVRGRMVSHLGECQTPPDPVRAHLQARQGNYDVLPEAVLHGPSVFKPVSLWVRSKRCVRVTPVIESLCHCASRPETVEEEPKSRDVFLSPGPLRTPEDAVAQRQMAGWGHWLSQVREPGAVSKLFPF